MDIPSDGQVALLIDFENLIYGLSSEAQDSFDPELLVRLSEQYGRVLVANAYADWRFPNVNQYQKDLYRFGIDLIHVLGKRGSNGFKNAVDIKLAVDAIGIVSGLPHITTFVLVSGDRDFIHVLKALRRQGKLIIGVAPRSSASDDLAELCDRFIRYEDFAQTEGLAIESESPTNQAAGAADIEAVRRALESIMSNHPAGLKGAQIKPLLRRELSPSFDESAYGFARMTDLLLRFKETVRVVLSKDGSDTRILPAGAESPGEDGAPAVSASSSPVTELIKQANLGLYRFDRDATRRRTVLGWLYGLMAEAPPFAWKEVQENALARAEEAADGDLRVTVTVLAKYRTVLYQSRAFVTEPDQENAPQRERLMRLQEDINSAESLVFQYEKSIAYKVADAVDGKDNVVLADFAEVLGLSRDNADDLAYCQSLLDTVS